MGCGTLLSTAMVSTDRTLPTLSVVIPAYNAAATIAQTLADVKGALGARAINYEVIVVNDGSTDATLAETAKAAGASDGRVRVMSLDRNIGKGATVRAGMLQAKGDWVLFMDADHSTRIEHVDLLWPEAARGSDVVIGSRRMAQSLVASERTAKRQLLGDLFPRITQLLCLPGISDTQCGFKAFKRWSVEPIFGELATSRFAFDVEALLRAKRMGASIAEVPVRWDNPNDSTLKWASDGPNMLGDVIAVSWRLRAGSAAARRLAALGRKNRESGVEIAGQQGQLAERIEIKPARATEMQAVQAAAAQASR